MCCFRKSLVATLLVLALSQTAVAEYVAGLGAEFDSEDGRAFSALASIGIGENTWLNGAASYNVSRGGQSDLETVYADVGIDHFFDPVGLRFGVAYWGDAELLDSRDLRGSLYWRNDRASLSLDYERRAFDLTVRTLQPLQSRSIEFDADGIGAAARIDLTDDVSVYANGMRYDYSRDIALQPSVDVVRVFAASRLSIVNSLLESRASGGIEISFADRVVDLQVSSWRTAVFDDRVDSVGMGLLLPVAKASDIELRVSSDDSKFAGRATIFSVFLYFYGN